MALACSKNCCLVRLVGSPYQAMPEGWRVMPNLSTISATSLPTLMQSVNLPPKILTYFWALLTSIACFRESLTQSAVPPLPPSIARGRTPQRSAIISALVKGLGKLSNWFTLSKMKSRSPSVTSLSGESTCVSVVPIQVFWPMGMTKNKRPSLAKKANTFWLALIWSTIKCTPLENTWWWSVDCSVVSLYWSTKGPAALINTFAFMGKISPLISSCAVICHWLSVKSAACEDT